MIGGACVLPSMTKGETIGRLVVVIDVNPSHGFWTARLMTVFGHEGKCTCRYNDAGASTTHQASQCMDYKRQLDNAYKF